MQLSIVFCIEQLDPLMQYKMGFLLFSRLIIIIIRSSLFGQWHATRTCPSLVSSTPL